MLLLDRAKQEKVNFVGEQKQEEIVVFNEVDGLEGQEELCFVNSNGTWYKKEPNFHYNNYQQKPFYNNQQAQIVEKTEHKAMERVKAQAKLKVAAEILKRDEHKAEKQVEREAVQKLKEVKLEGTTEIEQSPYDKHPFPQKVLTKAQKKVISKFRKDMSAVGVKLPEISHMRDAHFQMMLIKDILAHKEEVAELLDISTLQLDPPVTPKSNRDSGGDDLSTRRELKALQDKMDLLLLDRAKQEKVNFVGEHKQEEIVVVNEVDGLEGQEELCFVNANGTWYKKEPHFQYQNNYQQKPFYNNQQGSYQVSQNYSQSLSSERNQSTQGQAGSSTSAPQESSTDAMLKQILESQTRSCSTACG
ncbi:hypothetical protein DY000_02037603 [Brassica cretica]|uniref:Uncharacterized protein n=1 Tax=Brassica cretica TaxID=69181 RepID=A0ABQ7BAR2_BRACR|nr:hypothetical protein DY000_02037603 [Brassica cretica]